MEAKELRIGSITKQGVVKSFYEHGVHVGLGKTYKFYDLTPIPLTEQVLIDCGLIQLGDKKAKWYGDVNDMKMFIFTNEELFGSSMFYIHKWGTNFYFSISTLDDGLESFERLFKIDYLHQLQNCLLLKGQELEYKPNK